MTAKHCSFAVLAMCLLALVGCCSGNGNSLPNFAPVVAVAANSGSPQSHSVNGPFGTALVAMVTSNGLPESGIIVTFSAPTTGPSGTFAGKSTVTATSDASGLATAPAFTANGKTGIYEVTASAPSVATPALFDLTNTTGAPGSLTAMAGNNQSAAVDTAFTNPLQVTVVDSGQNPVADALVVFTAPSTGASGFFANSGSYVSTAMTNASGVATSSGFTANGIAGTVNVMASVSGASSSASFILTNLAGAPATITAVGGTPQSIIAPNAFTSSLSALVVDSLQNPIANAVVTFTAPTTGASVTFSDSGTSTTTETTNSSGIATTTTLTANSLAGTFTVKATAASETVGPAYFTLTNWPIGSQYYSFYLSGQEDLFSGELSSFYSLAGSVLIDPTGDVLAGEQDYNDGFSINSPEPSGDTITGGSLTLSSTTYQGTLVLDTNDSNVGVGGVETFGVQFANSNHALISQYDGSATSSGSLDLQTLPSVSTSNLAGGYAFTLSGTDPFSYPVAYGGVFSIAGSGQTLQNGLFDTNDAGIGVPVSGTALSGTLSLPDSFGRGTITAGALNYDVLEGGPSPVSLNYYVVGPEVIRIIDVDSTDSAVGSAYGQGTYSTAASNASLGSSIFGVAGNSLTSQYGAAGMFTTNGSSATFSGVGDDNEEIFGFSVPDATIAGTYSIATSGYGNLTVAPGDLGDVSAFGLYMTDPNLNLLDPNNTTAGVGGALLLDLDTLFAGGTGIVIPQTDTSSSDFTGDYAFGGQDQNYLIGSPYEFDFVGRATVTSGAFSGYGLVSDPFLSLGGTATDSGVRFASTPQPDPSNAGRYTMFSTNSTPNPLLVRVKGAPVQVLNVVMYQANGGQLLWLDEDASISSTFLGPLEQFGSFTNVPSGHGAVKPKVE